MSKGFSRIPQNAVVTPDPFQLYIANKDIDEFQTLLRLSKVGPPTWETQQQDRRFGITHEWIVKAKDFWQTQFDWRAQENLINSFPNFKMAIDDERGTFSVHFVALFSAKSDAIPIVLMHGWPGSFLEFLPMMGLWREKYTPENFPYHIIVPSLPGYTLSSGPPVDSNFGLNDVARIINRLMLNLGFTGGYVTQGGDVGSMVSHIMATQYQECRALHVNLLPAIPPESIDLEALTPTERQALDKSKEFRTTGSGYAMEHGTRPATIGLVLSSNPLALLAWIGEKFLEWSDEDPSLDDVLAGVTLYWFTSSFPRSIYPYRGMITGEPSFAVGKKKPLGYSAFRDLAVTPKIWAEHYYNLVWYREHKKGGHFAALERPQALLQDVEDFVKKVW